MKKLGLTLTALVLSSCLAQAGEKHLMHCFAFTPIKEATQADWDAFYKATDKWPQKMPAIKMVWYGKLLRPLAQFNTSDAAARKKAAAGEKGVSAELTATRREYGACMAFQGGPEILKEYTANSYHKEWMAAYEKVRVAGTTTFDIVGQ
ncbi:MAG TPA: hypothetical protein VM120_28745 [Bryobacteraceae bacterium]|nr:hypothetical protein [Bryobacteraceae bacterium]